MSTYSRRSLLGLGAAAATLGLPRLGAAAPAPRKAAKNIIFCVSDGMSWGVLSMAHQFRQRHHGKPGVWARLMADPAVTHGVMDTRSLSSLVTDSAAASSSWGSGVHVWNGQLNVLPDGTELTPIYRLLKDRAGMRTGLVSTATITHATPAGFAISHPDRDEEALIAEKYLASGVDVFMGGGARFFSEELRSRFAAAGYQLHTDRAVPVTPRAGQKFLGLYAEGHVPYEVDRLNDPATAAKVPSLAEMTEWALAMLRGGSEGFVLQIEGARVDHAAHANDFAGLIHDQLAFEAAAEVALRFAQEDGETLVVLTSDHGNSNPGLVGAGPEYGASNAGLDSLVGMTTSYERLLPRLNGLGVDDVRDQVAASLGVTLASGELALAMRALGKTSELMTIDQYSLVSSALTLALSNHTHICWSGRQHTSDVTTVSALGPGQEAFGGLVENIHVFGKLLAHRGIVFANPTMTFEEGQRIRGTGARQEPTPHWV